MEEIPVTTWNDLQDKLFEDSWNEGCRKWISPYVFRGLNDKEHDPNTNLIRLGCGGQDLEKLEDGLIRNFRKYAPPDVAKVESDWYLLSIAQHHGLPTRLLDWTFSPYIAMHFATSDTEKNGMDGAIWMVRYKDTHKYLPPVLEEEIKESQAWLFNIRMLSKSYEKLKDFDNSKGSPFMVFLEPPSIDDRIVNQFAVFSVISKPDVVPHDWLLNEQIMYKKIIIPKDLKWEIRGKLDQSNITERVLFPGLDGLCTWLKRHYGPGKS